LENNIIKYWGLLFLSRYCY